MDNAGKMKDPRRRPINTVERIQQNIDFIASRIVTERQPVIGWEFRQGYYRWPGNYDFTERDAAGTAVVGSAGNGSCWRPYSPGQAWGGADVTALFRASVPIPESMAGQTVWAHLVPGGEGILRVNGQPLGGLDFNHRHHRLTTSATAGQPFLLELECYFRDAPDDAIRNDVRITHHFREAELQVRDAEIESVYYDFQVALDVAGSMPEDSEQAQAIFGALQRAMVLFDPYQPSASECRRQILLAGRQLRAELYDHERFRPPGRVHLVGHCHIDLWYAWPYRESVRKNLRTNLIAADLAARHGDQTFTQSQAKLFADLQQHHPEEFDRVKAMVAAGRYEVVGGLWVEPDANLPSGESLIRQILYGQAFFRREFGKQSTVCWMPDVFGVSGALPQILVDSGYRLFYTNKQSVWHDTNEFPYDTFWWEGIDGSRIVAHLPPTHFVGKMDPYTVREQWADYQQKQQAPHVLYTYGFGDGGGGPTDRMLEYGRRLNRMDGMPRLAFGSAESFADALLQSARDLPVWADELYLEMHRGVQTTKGELKRKNRIAEAGLRAVEILESMAAWLGLPAPPVSLEPHWKTLLECQFHDGVTGTHCAEAGREIDQLYSDLLNKLSERRTHACRRLAANPSPDRVSVFNLSGLGPCGHLEWEGSDGVALGDEKGLAPTQRLSNGRNLTWLDDLPQLGHKVFEIRPTGVVAGSPFCQDGSEWTSPFYRLGFDAEGRIARFSDHATGREVLAAPGNRFELFEDRPGRFEAWDIAKDYAQRPVPLIRFLGSRVGEHGPVMSSRWFRWQVGASLLEQEICLYAHSRRVDFRTRIDWREERKLLRVSFPFAVHCSMATYEIALGHVRRSTRPVSLYDLAKFEVPFHRWLDVAEHGYGVALLNNGRYGGCVRDNTASLSLLRAPNFPDPTSDRGVHEFTYSLLPHPDDWRPAKVLAEAVRLNVPLEWTHGAAASPRMSYIAVSPPGVSVECVKPAEDGDGWILRLADFHGQGGTVRVQLPFVPAAVEPCTVVEEPKAVAVACQGETFTFTGRPFGIFTFRIRR